MGEIDESERTFKKDMGGYNLQWWEEGGLWPKEKCGGSKRLLANQSWGGRRGKAAQKKTQKRKVEKESDLGTKDSKKEDVRPMPELGTALGGPGWDRD